MLLGKRYLSVLGQLSPSAPWTRRSTMTFTPPLRCEEGLRQDGYRDQFQPWVCPRLFFTFLSVQGFFPLSSSWERLSYRQSPLRMEQPLISFYLTLTLLPSHSFLHCFTCSLRREFLFWLEFPVQLRKSNPVLKIAQFCKFPWGKHSTLHRHDGHITHGHTGLANDAGSKQKESHSSKRDVSL